MTCRCTHITCCGWQSRSGRLISVGPRVIVIICMRSQGLTSFIDAYTLCLRKVNVNEQTVVELKLAVTMHTAISWGNSVC